MGIILGDNPSGHCFVLSDLFQMSFFKLFMIVLLKIYTTGRIFVKICLKAIRDTFFSNMWSVIKGGRGTEVDIQQKGKVQIFSLAGGRPPPISSLSVTS